LFLDKCFTFFGKRDFIDRNTEHLIHWDAEACEITCTLADKRLNLPVEVIQPRNDPIGGCYELNQTCLLLSRLQDIGLFGQQRFFRLCDGFGSLGNLLFACRIVFRFGDNSRL
jgi:hypothetical protein